MRIKSIKELCNYSLEAEVTITDGFYDMVCFSQPCNYIIFKIIMLFSRFLISLFQV